ncbi:MAG: DUF2508 family protein [Cellulosilyticaceae bacterium]
MKRKEQKEQQREQEERVKEDKEVLAYAIGEVQEEMAATLTNFSDTTDPELLEYYTYYYKANEIKHSYLLRKLKKIYYNQAQ